MNLVVALDQRFDETPDHVVWTPGPFSYEFWRRDLDVFEGVRVVARVRRVPARPAGAVPAVGDGVTFARVPDYLGPWQYLLRARAVARTTRAVVGPQDAVILRVPAQVAACVESSVGRMGRPYALMVVGDPDAIFARGAVRHPLRPFLRRWFARQLRRQCATASMVAYVTAGALQRRYPPGIDTFAATYSDVALPPEAFVPAPRVVVRRPGPWRLVMVGALAQLYKGPDVLLDAVACCVRRGLNVRVSIVGDGRYRGGLVTRAARLGLEARARFLGELPAGAAVRAQLDAADVFVLPSRTEGLPRALVEAMARALPCVGSRVGGIPELLPAEALVPPGDAEALARRICEIVGDHDVMSRMSARNLATAMEYREAILGPRRTAFDRELRARTERWLRQGLGGERAARAALARAVLGVARTPE